MELVSVTKFAYLKELLEPKVKADIDGFPLNTEGYERAKNMIIIVIIIIIRRRRRRRGSI